MSDLSPRSVVSAVLRGARSACPNCGHAPLFRAYLKQVDSCAHCQEPFKHIRADDGPAWLTILIVGHIVVGLALAVEQLSPIPVALSIALFVSLALALIAWFLPRAKGMFVGAIWAMDATGIDAA